MRPLAATALLLSAAGLLVACGEGESPSSPSSGKSAGTQREEPAGMRGGGRAKDGDSDQPTGPDGTEIVLSESQYGPILFGPERQAIYLFDKETGRESECYGECAAAWPPVLTQGEPRAGKGVEAGLLGTTKRDDGSLQVTYGDRPLYYYVDDPPGEVLCHNVEEFGGLWLVLQGNGEPVA